MSSLSKSAPKCALCPSSSTDTIDVSSGHNIPVCAACLAGLEGTPSVPLPWEAAYDPNAHSLLNAVVEALVVELRAATAS